MTPGLSLSSSAWLLALLASCSVPMLGYYWGGYSPHSVFLKTKSWLSPQGTECQPHRYNVEIISFDPFVMYLDGFLSDSEVQHILAAVENDYQKSEVWVQEKGSESDGTESKRDQGIRNSQSAWLEASDPLARCVVQRAKSLLGNLQHTDIEPIQIVKYEGGERYRLHYDWLTEPVFEVFGSGPPARASTRLTTFFIYLEDRCEGGETYFPHVYGVGPDADGNKFSRTDSDRGLLVKPRRGSGVVWANMFMENGTGDWRSAHAALPVKSGKKIGMNLLTVYYVEDPIVGTYTPEYRKGRNYSRVV